jgi:hypothetical protein
MPKLFSYVVDHDLGYAPNPFGDFCTLAKCKYGTVRSKNGSVRRNIAELAEEGDWIAGTGGASGQSAGHGKLIYAMRVDEIIPLAEYCGGNIGNRIDAEHDIAEKCRYALISHHSFYFGRNAIDISDIPQKHLDHPFEKKGPGHRCDFSEAFIEEFAKWLKANFKVGVHGQPCDPHAKLKLSKCPSSVRRKGCA